VGRIVRFRKLGDAQVLELEECAPRAPGPDEVRIRIEAIGLNRADVQYRRGEYIEQARFPSSLGYEAAGTVEAVGQGCGLAIGERVAVLPAFSLNQYGTYAETALLPVHAVVPCPRGMDAQTAAGLWMSYLTAYGGLIERPGLAEGGWVLITAASGGVGCAAIEVAKAAGARVIATTRHREKSDRLIARGADHVVDTSCEDLAAAVQTITGGHGADLIFDPIAGSAMPVLADCAASDGVITLYGYFGGIATPLPLIPFLRKGLTLRTFSVFRLTADAERRRGAQGYITQAVERGRLRPAIDRVFPFEQIVQAHEYLEANLQTGKVVVST
jgi:NADPH:quinone reductase-like Zn-dependent oxidoreductase